MKAEVVKMAKKNNACMKAKTLDIINNRFPLYLSLSNLCSNNQWLLAIIVEF